MEKTDIKQEIVKSNPSVDHANQIVITKATGIQEQINDEFEDNGDFE